MDPLPLLRDLVACNSINPSLVPGAPGEGDAADVAARALHAAGLDVVRQDAAPGRPNVIGVLEGRQPGPAVMFCGHLDTVGVDGMTDPFVPRIDGDRLYGRGAQDMKGGIAAMIAAANALASVWSRGRLIVACVADEEHMSLGAEALVREWRADFAVVTEPTDLRLAIGHKGFAWLDITTSGRAAHGSRPEEGRDAIARMGRVLVALEARDRELRARPPAAFQGTGSLHASIIRGGAELSSYPAKCVLQMERRTVAGETGESVLEETAAILDALRRDDPEFEAAVSLAAYRPAYALAADHQLVRVFRQLLDDGHRTSEPTGMSFWTDAAILADAGIPSVLFGPGGAGLHSREEYVLMNDVRACALALAVVARRLVG